MLKKPQKPEVVMPVKPESPKPALMDGGIIGISIFALFIGAMGLFFCSQQECKGLLLSC